MSARQLARITGIVALSAFLAACGGSPETDKTKLVERGDAFIKQAKFAEAIISYRSALAIDNRYAQAHVKLAEAYLQSTPPDLSAATRERVVAADLLPSDADAQVKASQAVMLAQRYEDALSYARKAIAIDPKNLNALLVMAGASAQLGDPDSAASHLAEAIRLAPNDARPYTTLGAIKLAAGDRAEAEEAFKHAVEVDPKSIVAYVALGDFYWGIGRLAEAEPVLKKVVELNPKDLRTQKTLVDFYLSTGRDAEAEAPLKALAATQKDIPSRLALADYYIREQRYEDATATLKAIAAEKSGGTPAVLRLAAIDYARNLRDSAHKQLDAVIAAQASNSEALQMKARFLMLEEKVDEALARAKAAVAADQKSSDAQYLLGTIQLRKGNLDDAAAAFTETLALNPLAWDAELHLAELRLQQGSPDAVQLAESAAKRNPNSALAQTQLARTLMLRGSLAQAQDILSKLLSKYDGSATVHVEMGVLRLLQKDMKAARREFDRALTLDPTSIEALRGKIDLEIQEKNMPAARAALDARLLKTPNQPELLQLAARTYGAAGDTAQQEAALRKLLDVDKTNLPGFQSLAELYAKQGKLDAAKVEYEKLAKAQPNSSVAPQMIGIILEAQKKTDEAQKVYEQAVGNNPSAVPFAANNLAWLYAEKGANLDVALRLAQGARQVSPNTPEIMDTLGWIYYKKDLATLAVSEFEAAVKADPRNPLYLYHQGLAAAKAGDAAKARRAFDAALRIQPGYREADDARKKLPPS